MAENKPQDSKERKFGRRGFQRAILKFVLSPYFAYFMTAAIILSCTFVAMDDVEAKVQRYANDSSGLQNIFSIVDWLVLALFTLEMILKMIGLGIGFIATPESQQDSELAGYFASQWNRLDCFIVLMSWVLYIYSSFSGNSTISNLARSVRLLRLARPLSWLRTAKSVRLRQVIFYILPTSAATILDAFFLLLFVITMFSIFGLNLYGLEGALLAKCVVDNAHQNQSKGFLQWSGTGDPTVCGASYGCSEGFRCSCKPAVLDDGTVETRPYSFLDPLTGDVGCLMAPSPRPWDLGLWSDAPISPQLGFSSFNDFPFSALTVFTAITLDSWSSTMLWCMDAGNEDVSAIFFVLLIWIIAFNVMNLFIVGIYEGFAECEETGIVPAQPVDIDDLHLFAVQEDISFVRSRRGGGIGALQDFLMLLAEWYRTTWAKIDEYNQPSAKPLNPVALRVKKLLLYPGTPDECGNLVSSELMLKANRRDTKIFFGPGVGQWKIVAMAHLTSLPDHRPEHTWQYLVKEDNEYEPGTILCEGRSENYQRKDLWLAVNTFPKASDFKDVDERDLDNVEFSEEESYFAFFAALTVIANMAMLAMKHFDGDVIMISVPHDPSMPCCNSDCSLQDQDRCPRGLTVMTRAWSDFLSRGSTAMNCIFTFELILKIISVWSFPRYVLSKRPQNLIDFSLVVVADLFSFLGLISKGSAIVDPSLFRCVLRLPTVMKALRSIPMLKDLNDLVQKSLNTLSIVCYVLFMLLIWHFLCGLIAMQSFSCEYYSDLLCGAQVYEDATCPIYCSRRVGNRCVFTEDQMYEHCPFDPYKNFNSFGRSILVLFCVTTGDNDLITTLVNAMRSNSDSVAPGFIFFVVFYFFSFAVLYGLLIVVVIMTFDPKDSEKLQMQKKEYTQKVVDAIARAKEVDTLSLQFKDIGVKKKKRRRSSLISYLLKNVVPDIATKPNVKAGRQNRQQLNTRKLTKVELNELRTDLKAKLKYNEVDVEDIYLDLRACDLQDYLDGKYDQDPDIDIFWGYLRAPDAETRNVRWWVQVILKSQVWNIFIAVVIMSSTVVLFLQSKVASENLVSQDISAVCDVLFFSVFLFECVVKILDHGSWSHNQAYFRLNKNRLEFVLVLLQAIDLLKIANGIAVFRALRSLRILRAFSKVKRLQLIVLGLTEAVKLLAQIILIWIFMLVLFAIVGIYLFDARMYSCNDPNFTGYPLNPTELPGSKIGWRENCVGPFITSKSESGVSYVSANTPTYIYIPRVWNNPHYSPSEVGYNFDNFYNAVQTLFEISTMRHWSDYAFDAGDSTNIGQNPIRAFSPWSVFYFIAWILVSDFFFFPLMISAVVYGIRNKSGTGELISVQRNWRTVQKQIKALMPNPRFEVPQGRNMSFLLWLSRNGYWQGFFALVLLANACLMTTDHYNQTADWQNNMLAVNWTFVALYLVELGLKFVVEGTRFFYDPWNVFDFSVILSSIVELTVGSGLGLYFLRILRLLRVGRLLRLVRRLPRLRYMIESMMASLFSGFMNAFFIGVVMVIFAVVGNSYLCATKYGFGINRRLNFDSPRNGMLLLFVAFTGDGWQSLMRDSAVQPPMCTPDEEVQALLGQGYMLADGQNNLGDCGEPIIAIVYFDLFFFIGPCAGYNILRALVLGVQIENILNFRLAEKGIIRESHLRSFQSVWGQLDPNLTGKIPIWTLRNFIFKLAATNNPLGWFGLRSDGRVRVFKLAIVRAELQYLMGEENKKEKIPMVDFQTLLLTLGLHTVELNALMINEKIIRKAQLEVLSQEVVAQRLQGIARGRTTRKLFGKEAKRRQQTGIMAVYKRETAVKSDLRVEDPAAARARALKRDRFKATMDRTKEIKMGEFVLAECAVQDMELAVENLERSTNFIV